MNTATTSTKVSRMAENLIGSEIIKLAGEINNKIKQGEQIYNLTIGDFSPKIFPIPALLTSNIIDAYNNHETNYPPADGILELRNAVSTFLQQHQGLTYKNDEILIAGGARPLIYALYQTIVDANDTVLFPVPSWNNNHYTHLTHGKQKFVETTAQNNFMPTADELRPHIQSATLLALCSPLNPTGTTFTEQGLREICELVLEENNRRSPDKKPLYVMYDQIYWVLTFNGIKHVDPVSLYPEMRNYTIYVDGLSKAFAATGVRVGWGFGPKHVMDKMKSILGHVGAWAPKAEQVAVANYLGSTDVQPFLLQFKQMVNDRLTALYTGINLLKSEGLQVEAIEPQAAIYLTLKFDYKGYTTPAGDVLSTTPDITQYLLNAAKLAIVPFSAFGSSTDSTWYRASIGTCQLADIEGIISNLRTALSVLKK
jgi:aspartate aminotransferase